MASSRRRLVLEAKRDQFKVIGVGSFADVYLVADSELAFKVPFDAGDPEQSPELTIYDRLGIWHPYILRNYGEADSVLGKGLMLQYLPIGILAKHLDLNEFPVQRLDWPSQAVEAIRYIHSQGIIHCDIGAHNFLIQNDGTLALADFGGSSLDGSSGTAWTSPAYSRPLSKEERSIDQSEKADDIFALGTLIYEISLGHRLWTDKTHGETDQLFRKGEFPDLNGLEVRVRKVVEGCWRGSYRDAEEIKNDLVGSIVLVTTAQRYYWVPYYGIALGLLLATTILGKDG